MIEKNHRVTLAYTLKDAEGQVLDQAPHNNPLTYVHGYGRILPGLEDNLEGRKEGEHFFLQLEENEAYGPYDDNLLIWVDKEELEHLGELSIGLEIEMYSKMIDIDPSGENTPFENTFEDQDELDELGEEEDEDEYEEVTPFIVKEMSETQVLLDGNHPLAGRAISLEISILSVEMASFEEIEEMMLESEEDDDLEEFK